jgi:hypothetical protein
MVRSTTMHRIVALGIAFGLAASSHAAASEADVVKQLTTAMTEQHLDAIATVDPANPSRFIAAMLVPGAQLLVVAAEYPNPSELQALIGQHNYRDVYTALHQPAAQKTRVFFIDSGCDGVQVDREMVDVMYEKGASQVLFDGDWKKSKLSQADYEQKVQDAGERYTQLVGVLKDSVAAAASR